MDESKNFQRIYCRLKDPNPLFTKWVEEWKIEAERKNSKSKFILSEALESLKKFPLPLESGKDCAILRGFGKTLCFMLDDKLEQYRKEHGWLTNQGPQKYIIGIDFDFAKRMSSQNVDNKIEKSEKIDSSLDRILEKYKLDSKENEVINVDKYQEIFAGSSDIENIPSAEVKDNLEQLCNLETKKHSPSKFDYKKFSFDADDDVYNIDASPASVDQNCENNLCVINPTHIISDDEIETVTIVKQSSDLFRKKPVQAEPLKRTNSGTNKLYSPAYRSGPYAILVVLLKSRNNEKLYLTKEEIIILAQPLCDKSFSVSDNGSRYTAWNSMSNLVTKNLVSKTGRPAKFSLTEDGAVVAEELLKKYVEQSQVEINDVVCSEEVIVEPKKSNKVDIKATQSNKRTVAKATELEIAIFPPNTFETILLVDTQETSGMAKRAYDETIQLLTSIKVKYEIRRLNVGDFAWICRDSSNNRELLLPYIVERKRMDDFGSSIRDGRFREQKFRLKQSGIQNLIYLIESYGRNEHTGLPITSLLQAACNTSIQDNFILKFTNTHKDSMMYLAVLTRMLTENISNKTLVSCPKENLKEFNFQDDIIALMDFTEFQNTSKKTKKFTVQNMFIKHLMRIKGISMDKALGIVEKYPSPHDLYEAYESCPAFRKKDLLSDIQFGPQKRKIGPAMSETIYNLFTLEKYS